MQSWAVRGNKAKQYLIFLQTLILNKDSGWVVVVLVGEEKPKICLRCSDDHTQGKVVIDSIGLSACQAAAVAT